MKVWELLRDLQEMPAGADVIINGIFGHWSAEPAYLKSTPEDHMVEILAHTPIDSEGEQWKVPKYE